MPPSPWEILRSSLATTNTKVSNGGSYFHQPFVIEGDAYGEDIVEENQSDSAKAPEEKLDRPRHMEPLTKTDHRLQTNSGPAHYCSLWPGQPGFGEN